MSSYMQNEADRDNARKLAQYRAGVAACVAVLTRNWELGIPPDFRYLPAVPLKSVVVEVENEAGRMEEQIVESPNEYLCESAFKFTTGGTAVVIPGRRPSRQG